MFSVGTDGSGVPGVTILYMMADAASTVPAAIEAATRQRAHPARGMPRRRHPAEAEKAPERQCRATKLMFSSNFSISMTVYIPKTHFAAETPTRR